jgi:hypothetical protein
MKRDNGESDWLIAWGYWERERAAAVLHDEILSVLVVITQQSGVAARALRRSAENQHKQRA